MDQGYNHKKISDINQRIQHESSTNRANALKKTIATRIRTSFIFPLAEFERTFGVLWGEELPDGAELTPEQQKFEDLYEEARKAILDNGNAQLRALETELYKYFNLVNTGKDI